MEDGNKGGRAEPTIWSSSDKSNKKAQMDPSLSNYLQQIQEEHS